MIEPAEARVRIDSKKRWVHTGIRLHAGVTYRLAAYGSWTDLAMTCGPEGYASREYPNKIAGDLLAQLEWIRRVRLANWFALIGAIDSNRRAKFVIGREKLLTPEHDGELVCFANDFWLAYFNNCGSVELDVTEVQAERAPGSAGQV